MNVKLVEPNRTILYRLQGHFGLDGTDDHRSGYSLCLFHQVEHVEKMLFRFVDNSKVSKQNRKRILHMSVIIYI